MFYETKVEEIAQKVIDVLSGENVTEGELKTTIDQYAKNHVYYKSSAQSRKEFLKDIEKEVRKTIKTKKATKYTPLTDNDFLYEVASLIQEATGSSFPDGDPIDTIQIKLPRIVSNYNYTYKKYDGVIEDIRKNKSYSLMEILDKASQKFLDVGSYNDYLSNLWDDIYGDAIADLTRWEQDSDPEKEKWKPTTHTMFGPDARKARNPWRESLGEALDVYDNKIELAISDLGLVEEEEAKRIAKKMKLQDYLNFIIAVDEDETETARSILSKYLSIPSVGTVESKINELVTNESEFIVHPGLFGLTEMEQREIINNLQYSTQQKLLANLRGYKHSGIYENSLFQVHLVEEVIRLLKNTKIEAILEIAGAAPGVQQRQQAYGASTDNTEAEKNTDKKQAKFTDEKGEEQEGEVVSQNSQFTTVKTDKGTKRVPTDNVYVKEQLADIIRLAGLNK